MLEMKLIHQTIKNGTLQRLADYLGVDVSTLYRWETVPVQYERRMEEFFDMLHVERMEIFALA